MGLLDKVLADDAAAAADTDGLGEAIVYTPRGGTPVTVNAIVWRDVPDAPREVQRGNATHIEIEIAYDATRGVTSVNTGGDTVTLALRYGGTTATKSVTQVILQGTGFWRLMVR